MAYQPMGAVPGIGIRRANETTKKTALAEHELERAIVDAGNLTQDLLDHPALYIVAQQLESRINGFLEKDEQSIALMKIVNTWKGILTGPKYAQEKVKKLLGPQLVSIKETQAAP
jgi:hypothetical protein